MIVFAKAEFKKNKIRFSYSVSINAVSSLHGLRKFEKYIARAFRNSPDSMECSTRQPYTSLDSTFPLATINNNNNAKGKLYASMHDVDTGKLLFNTTVDIAIYNI